MKPHLRTILLVIGGLLSVPRWSTAQGNPAQQEREQRAMDILTKAGGLVWGDKGPLTKPVSYVWLIAPIREHLLLLKTFPSLRSLSLSKLTNADLAQLSGLDQLASLEIEGSSITDAGLAHLKELPRLYRLDLSNVPITDTWLERLRELDRLRILKISNIEMTDASVAKLKEGLPYALILVTREEVPVHTRVTGGQFLLTLGTITLLAGGAALFLFWCPWRSVRKRRWMWKMPIVLAVIVAMGLDLLRLTPIMKPIQEGDPATFWLHAASLDIGVKRIPLSCTGFYQPRDGWLVYYTQEIHGCSLYRIKVSEAAALFPKVVDRLQNAPPGILHPDVEKGFQEWLRTRSGPDDMAGFLARVYEAKLARWRQEDPSVAELIRSEEKAFSDRWERIQRYSQTVLFEFLFLTGLILFMAWPWLRGSGRLGWAIHLGLLPTLFFLPYWLGYAWTTFTSIGPSGGVLYPWLLGEFGGLSWTALDRAIVRTLPQILDPLSQTPGPMMSLTFFRGPSPVAALMLGVLLGSTLYWGKLVRRLIRLREEIQLRIEKREDGRRR
jgi:hypothetical protein